MHWADHKWWYWTCKEIRFFSYLSRQYLLSSSCFFFWIHLHLMSSFTTLKIDKSIWRWQWFGVSSFTALVEASQCRMQFNVMPRTILPSSTTYLESGRGGSSSSWELHTSLNRATLATSSLGIPRCSQNSLWDVVAPSRPWSALGSHPSRKCSDDLPRETLGRHPY